MVDVGDPQALWISTVHDRADPVRFVDAPIVFLRRTEK